LHRTYYRGIERGVRNVSLVNIEKVAKGLRKSLAELFDTYEALLTKGGIS
jgi:transcriptional regulator with XRE-family HTH domain